VLRARQPQPASGQRLPALPRGETRSGRPGECDKLKQTILFRFRRGFCLVPGVQPARGWVKRATNSRLAAVWASPRSKQLSAIPWLWRSAQGPQSVSPLEADIPMASSGIGGQPAPSLAGRRAAGQGKGKASNCSALGSWAEKRCQCHVEPCGSSSWWERSGLPKSLGCCSVPRWKQPTGLGVAAGRFPNFSLCAPETTCGSASAPICWGLLHPWPPSRPGGLLTL